MEALPEEDITRVVVRLWEIWHAKRKAVHENVFQSPLSMHCFVKSFLSELATPGSQPKHQQSVPARLPRWIPPLERLTKINTDAAISKNARLATTAAVARGGDGTFIEASVVVVEGITDAESAKALACREALALAVDVGVRRIRVASDCVNAVRSIGGKG